MTAIFFWYFQFTLESKTLRQAYIKDRGRSKDKEQY